MKLASGLFAFGVLLIVARGALATVLPPGVRPDLGLLAVVGLGLHLPGAAGLLAAAGLGVLTDVLTGALLGHHAFLFVLAFAVTRLAGAQLDLRRGLPVVVLVAAVSAANGLLGAGISRLFAAEAPWPELGRWVGQAGVDALVSPLVLPAMVGIVHALSEDDRRAVELAPRRREA